ncbi:hypothetical protein FHX37_0078 [Haloactinospora alba]|uniref:Uncharacterized protein n=1 Tax=Haloactinospora alba TaxID=405555 RepID=A0A543NEE1_9ACTN|nr:hypothetical protein [Haloactinospora alba]TQN30217.1 hypothetical protein FHX37_0078 [Haloactinospora alba]
MRVFHPERCAELISRELEFAEQRHRDHAVGPLGAVVGGAQVLGAVAT